MNKSLTVILLMLCSVLVLTSNDFMNVAYFYFYFLIAYVGIDIFLLKQLKFNHVWCVAFIYMILSEAFSSQAIAFFPNSLESLQLFVISNNLVLIGYRLTSDLKIKDIKYEYTQVATPMGLALLMVLLGVFCYYEFQFSIEAFTNGRLEAFEADESGIGLSVINSIGFILPAVFAFYFVFLKKKSIVIPTLLSLPVFILFFMGGTRFLLLFSVLGFVLVLRDKLSRQNSTRSYFLIGGAVLMLVFISAAMKGNRNLNAVEVDKVSLADTDIPTWISTNYSSPEGAIDMTNLLIDHFNSHDHLYGSSSSFILYFWVPRSIWKDKPLMIGNWLVRKYRDGFAKSHSVTFGFIGDLYADFGWYALVPIYFMGTLMKRAENLKDKMMRTKSYGTVLGAMFYPVLFFFVRDPITSMMNFFGILFFYFFIKKFVFQETKVKLADQ